MKKKRKTINGIEHVKCVECGQWFEFRRGVARCPEHHSIFVKKYNDRRLFSYSRYVPVGDKEEEIEKDLAGKSPISGLYSGCTKEQIEAMQRGDVEALLRI